MVGRPQVQPSDHHPRRETIRMAIISHVRPGHINGGPGYPCQVNIEHDSKVEWSSSPKADESWSFTDVTGHFHAYDQSTDKYGDRYPTLLSRRERVACDHSDHDPDCDGADIFHYHCRICDEEITPGLIPGPHSFVVPGRSQWYAKLTVPVDDLTGLGGEQVSFRMEAGEDAELFGIALVDRMEVGSDGRATLDLLGMGPLGRRAVRTRVAV
jgi:hypothetical protein